MIFTGPNPNLLLSAIVYMELTTTFHYSYWLNYLDKKHIQNKQTEVSFIDRQRPTTCVLFHFKKFNYILAIMESMVISRKHKKNKQAEK